MSSNAFGNGPLGYRLPTFGLPPLGQGNPMPQAPPLPQPGPQMPAPPLPKMPQGPMGSLMQGGYNPMTGMSSSGNLAADLVLPYVGQQIAARFFPQSYGQAAMPPTQPQATSQLATTATPYTQAATMPPAKPQAATSATQATTSPLSASTQATGTAVTVPDSSSHQGFINSLTPTAQAWADKTGIPASVWLAIAANESNWGAAGNALFGIKGSGNAGSLNSPTWEYVNGQHVNTTDNFATYQTPNDAFAGFWSLMQTPRYQGATQYLQQTGDWQGFLQQINQSGYATDPVWGQHIAQMAQDTIAPMLGG